MNTNLRSLGIGVGKAVGGRIQDSISGVKHYFNVRAQIREVHRNHPDLVPMLTKMQEGADFMQMFDSGIDSDESKFTPLSQHPRDFSPHNYERIVGISRGLYEKDLMFKRLLDAPMDIIASVGVQFKSDNARLEELWKDFWEKPVVGFSNLFMGRDGLLKENLLSGELNLPLIPIPNGELEIAYLEPLQIKDIRKVPGNALKDDKIVLRNNLGSDGQVLDILRPVAGVMFGDVFRHTLNKPVNAKRGKPFLTTLLDWTDRLDQAVWNELDRWTALKSHLWHVSAPNEKVAKELEEKYNKTGDFNKPGAVRVTTDNVTMEAVTPDLKASDGSIMFKMIRSFMVGGSGMHDLFMGFGGEINVATAREIMKIVAFTIEYIQTEMVKILTAIFAYQIQTAAAAGKFTNEGQVTSLDMVDDWKIVANQVLKKDFVAEAASFSQTVNALSVAKQNGFIGETTGRKQYAQAANEFGFECTLKEIEEDLENDPEPDMFGSTKVATGDDVEQPSVTELLKMSQSPKTAYLRDDLSNKALKRAHARDTINNALKSGEVKKGVCGRCASVKVEAHHVDYNKPLSVKWYCVDHHPNRSKLSENRRLAYP